MTQKKYTAVDIRNFLFLGNLNKVEDKELSTAIETAKNELDPDFSMGRTIENWGEFEKVTFCYIVKKYL